MNDQLAWGDAPECQETPRQPAAPGERLGVGIHANVPEATYHADPAETPSASSSILRTLIDQSPMHAHWDHPRLNSECEPSAPTDFQIAGRILHWHITQAGECPYRALAFDSYRTKEAKALKQEALDAGLAPILEDKLDELLPVADALRSRIETDHPAIHAALHDPETLFEVTLICRIAGVLVRTRIDVLPPARYGFALDLKFTTRSAEPEGWGRTLVSSYLFQAALYPESVHILRGDKPEFRFLVCETDAPYGCSLHAMDPQMEDLAHRKVSRALALWDRCMTSGEWPGYPAETHYQEPPPWELTRWANREHNDGIREGEQYQRLLKAAGGPIA